jgi:hypothetical protein
MILQRTNDMVLKFAPQMSKIVQFDTLVGLIPAEVVESVGLITIRMKPTSLITSLNRCDSATLQIPLAVPEDHQEGLHFFCDT